MKKLIDPYMFLNGVNFTQSGHEVLFSCPCPAHAKKDNFNAKFNIATGQWITFGACKTVFGEGQLVKLIFWLREECGIDCQVNYVDEADIQVTFKEEYDWRDLLTLPLAYGNAYLESRQVDNSMIERYDIRADEERIVFPNINDEDKVVGVNIRYLHRKMRYMYYGERTSVFRLGDLYKYSTSKPLVITEGVFGALRGAKYGFQTTCLFGTGGLKDTTHLQRFELILGALDRDEAGFSMAEKLLKKKELNIWIVKPNEFDEMLEKDWKETIDGERLFLLDSIREKWYK